MCHTFFLFFFSLLCSVLLSSFCSLTYLNVLLDPVVIESSHSQLPTQGYLLLHGDGFTTAADKVNTVTLSRGSCIHPVIAISEQLLNCTFTSPSFPLDDHKSYALQVLSITSGSVQSRFKPRVVAIIREAPILFNATLFLSRAANASVIGAVQTPKGPVVSGFQIQGRNLELVELAANQIQIQPGGFSCNVTLSYEIPNGENDNSSRIEILVCNLQTPHLISAGDYELFLSISDGVHSERPLSVQISASYLSWGSALFCSWSCTYIFV